ncbi:hypothetical protein EZV62_004157 [Acer yangbiense]|uniref:Protein kinase domain-containing protein n=1 Tax=Acer yangbiense TaxID=1000413 RepID=A0A5C7IKT6_9ROSI|nr:hypothetical protein EZV62_004157 [Acer yangbiense]
MDVHRMSMMLSGFGWRKASHMNAQCARSTLCWKWWAQEDLQMDMAMMIIITDHSCYFPIGIKFAEMMRQFPVYTAPSKGEKSLVCFQLWVKVRVLGKGSYGVVTLAVNSEDPSLPSIAVKSSRLEDSHSLKSLEKEKRILDHLYGSPHILAFLADTVSFDDQLGGLAYDLFLEYAPGGSLSDLIKKRGGRLPEHEVQDYTRMILKGLCGVHKNGYVHCDLKPDNILVLPLQDGTNYLKIADFGLAKEPGEEKQYGDYFRFRFRGTPLYMSPESFLFGEIEWGLDIWSLGCVVVEMLTGKHAMRWVGDVHRNLESGCAFVMQQPNVPEYMSNLGKDFLTSCFARNPRERWTAEMLLSHPYLLPEMAVMSATNYMQVRRGWCSLFEDGHQQQKQQLLV